MSKFWRGLWERIYSAFWSLGPDAEFEDLPWQGWDDARSQEVETKEHDCADAVFALTQKGYVVTGVNRSARILNISTPGRIAMDVAQPYDSRVSRKGFLHNVTRICTHGER